MAEQKQRLPRAVQVAMVTAFAHHATLAEVVQEVKDRFGLEIDKRHAKHYDPSGAGYDGAKEWVDLFHAERAKFLETAPPIADARYRLHRLQRHYDRLAARGDDRGAVAVLEVAERVMSGGYGPGGSLVPVLNLHDQARRDAYYERLGDSADWYAAAVAAGVLEWHTPRDLAAHQRAILLN